MSLRSVDVGRRYRSLPGAQRPARYFRAQRSAAVINHHRRYFWAEEVGRCPGNVPIDTRNTRTKGCEKGPTGHPIPTLPLRTRHGILDSTSLSKTFPLPQPRQHRAIQDTTDARPVSLGCLSEGLKQHSPKLTKHHQSSDPSCIGDRNLSTSVSYLWLPVSVSLGSQPPRVPQSKHS